MYNTKEYYYTQYNSKELPLNKKHKEKLKKIITPEIYEELQEKNNYTYLVNYKEEIIGFFSFKITKTKIKIICIYIIEEYRQMGIATSIINNILYATTKNGYEIKYMTANTFIESCMFFFKKGFDLCKVGKKDPNKRNIVLMYKKIES